ncbi:sulfur carrier protein ThiS [Aquimarina agarivorans]|uniref:sulfur carrier protein ThiS n=1 Tax=Aquimarina agarivorans TaxID=980584 RepID=UPI000248EDBE|nr:sulfur carrier protein ThiS [Aquimarina agarivorans]
MIHINVNHKPKTIAPTTSLDTLLNQLAISKQGIAVAINNQIISKNNWKETQLNNSDAVTIIQATQGG